MDIGYYLQRIKDRLNAPRNVGPISPEAQITTPSMEQLAMAQQQATREYLFGSGMQTTLAPNIFGEDCTINGKPMADEPGIDEVLETTGKLALQELLLPPFRVAEWEWDGCTLEVAIEAQQPPLVSVPIWRLWRGTQITHPAQNVNPRYASDLLCRKNGGRFAPGTEWAHDHISAVLAKLTTQYKAMLLQRKVDIKTQVLEAEQAHAFAVEEYKEILAAAITERKLKEHRVSS